MYDVIIIGAGPAGISSSLYIARANLRVLVLYSGISNVEKAPKIDNYYGFPNGITGPKLFENGIIQAQNLGVAIKKEEVTSIENSFENSFTVKTAKNSYNAKSVIISTGNQKINPKLKGIKEFEGKGISYCAICDAFFYRGKTVGIIGNGEFAIAEANTLKNVTSNIEIFTNGEKINTKNRDFKINTAKISEIVGIDTVQGLILDNGSKIPLDGIFIALGEAGAIDFAKTLGIVTKNDIIVVNENMETNVKGIYACGNITGGLLQISKAVYEGSVAALSAIKHVKGEK